MPQVTELSVLGVPGKVHVFVAKGAGHEGEFTQLSVLAVPGGIQTFQDKTPAIIEDTLTSADRDKAEIYRRKREKQKIMNQNNLIIATARAFVQLRLGGK